MSASLSDPDILTHLRILGLIDKLITGPLWRLAESGHNILELRNWAIQLISYCEKIVDEPEYFYLALSPFRNYPAAEVPKINHDEVFTALVDNLENDLQPFLNLVSVLFQNMSDYFKRLLSQFLPTGEFANFGENEAEMLVSAPLSNRKAESVFGLMDYLFHKAPSMTMITRKIYVMTVHNKVFDWLEAKSVEEQDQIIKRAKSREKIISNEIKNDKNSLHSSLWTAMMEEKRKQELAANRIENRKSYWDDKRECSVKIDTIEQVDEIVSNTSKKTTLRKIIVENIRYYQYLMIVSGKKLDKDLFKVTKNGTAIALPSLTDKLKLIISKQ